MRLLNRVILGCWLLAQVASARAATPEQNIRHVLDQQQAAWNRGDLREFVSSYAPHCTLVGSGISETTREQVFRHFEERYPSRGAMGKLTFSGLTVRLLDGRVAMATGHWHLEREKGSGGPVGGLFSLVFQLVDGSWQIELDHTS